MKKFSLPLVFKKIFAFAAITAASVTTLAVAQGPNLLSSAALIVDAQSGEAIFAKNANTVSPIASITKLMTAVIVLDANQALDEVLHIDIDDLDFLKASSSRLSIGSELTRREMLQLALMSSENRAASALGRYYPGGMKAAVSAMNQKAAALGMKQTHYVDTSGLSPSNVSTASDLARLVQAAQDYPLIREFSTQSDQYVQIPTTGQTLHYNNSNALVKSGTWDIALQKTGFIREAGRCVVMLAEIAQRKVVMVLLDSVSSVSRVGDAERIKTWIETGEVVPLPRAPVVAPRARLVQAKHVSVRTSAGKNAKNSKATTSNNRSKKPVVSKKQRK